jgi:DNA-directed RNA polymerase I subunit RPA1
MNMHFPQNIIAQSEARSIANTDSQYLVPTSGDPIRGLIQDHVVSAVHMTNKETFFDREEYHQLLFGSLRLEEGRIQTVTPAIIKPRPLWTGKQVISTIMKNLTPHGFAGLNLRSTSKTPGKRWGIHASEDSVLFVDGDLLTGILDKAQFGASSYGMVHSVYEIYGAEAAGRLLGILSRLFTAYLQMRGFTCGMDDLRLTAAGETIRNDLVEGAGERGLKAALGFVQLADADPASSSTQTHLRTRLEEVLRDDNKQAGLDRAMMAETSVLTSSIIEKTLPSEMEKRFPANNMALMTVSGAKGSNVNVSQIACLLGQQALEGRRVPTMVSGKTLPSFRAFDTQPRAGGFVAQRFLTGIKPQEYYFHCMAGREGLIDTAVKTSRSGYLQRCLIKHLEGCKVAYDSTVRNSDGDIIQFYYGEDGLDVTKQKHLTQFEVGQSAAGTSLTLW